MRFIFPILAVIFLVIASIYLVKGSPQGKILNSAKSKTTSTTPTEIPYVTLQDRGKSAKEIIIEDISHTVSCDGQCAVTKVYGDYAKGQMPRAYWIAAKIQGTWEVVVTGNGIPQCRNIDTYNIPREIFGNCIESSGNLRYLQ